MYKYHHNADSLFANIAAHYADKGVVIWDGFGTEPNAAYMVRLMFDGRHRRISCPAFSATQFVGASFSVTGLPRARTEFLNRIFHAVVSCIDANIITLRLGHGIPRPKDPAFTHTILN